MRIKIQNMDKLNLLSAEQKTFINNGMKKFKVAESKENGWEEHEIEAENMEEALKTVCAEKDIFVAEVE